MIGALGHSLANTIDAAGYWVAACIALQLAFMTSDALKRRTTHPRLVRRAIALCVGIAAFALVGAAWSGPGAALKHFACRKHPGILRCGTFTDDGDPL